MLYLLDDLFLNTFLLLYGRLHGLAILKRCIRLVKQLFKLANLKGSRLFEGHSASTATMVIEVAIVAESLVVNAAISG